MEWRRIVNNKMKWHGNTDFDKKTIEVNKKKAKTGSKGELLDTIVHEEMHKAHPKMHEKTVRKLTKKKIPKMGSKTKRKLYSKYK